MARSHREWVPAPHVGQGTVRAWVSIRLPDIMPILLLRQGIKSGQRRTISNKLQHYDAGVTCWLCDAIGLADLRESQSKKSGVKGVGCPRRSVNPRRKITWPQNKKSCSQLYALCERALGCIAIWHVAHDHLASGRPQRTVVLFPD